MGIKFDILAREGQARAGILHTDHGDVQTPTITTNFTPALLRSGLSAGDIKSLGVEMILVNTLHTMMENNMQVFDIREKLNWSGPILADSGGFQMVSLAQHLRVKKDHIEFTWDDKKYQLSPKDILEWQKKLGIDIMMPLDRVWHLRQKNPLAYFLSVLTTEKWFKQSHNVADADVFYIIQGGLNKLARKISINYANNWLKMGIPGVSIGGLAFGESRSKMYSMIKFCTQRLPENNPRHLLGVGHPVDLLESIERGIDTFDCVAHTREARHGRVLTDTGYLHIKNSCYIDDNTVLEKDCDCPVCQLGITRSQLRVGLKSPDIEQKRFTQIQLMMHNIRFLMRLMEQSQVAIRQGKFGIFKQNFVVNFSK
ncbi:queuine tRNA-ribosyltransferase family protein [Patescibacteria group bacterium]|nr:queuine tRNA-ribosyltransferase family protein [Patescibacteria group bacterium]